MRHGAHDAGDQARERPTRSTMWGRIRESMSDTRVSVERVSRTGTHPCSDDDTRTLSRLHRRPDAAVVIEQHKTVARHVGRPTARGDALLKHQGAAPCAPSLRSAPMYHPDGTIGACPTVGRMYLVLVGQRRCVLKRGACCETPTVASSPTMPRICAATRPHLRPQPL